MAFPLPNTNVFDDLKKPYDLSDEKSELEALRQEVAMYRWRDKKAFIIERLGLSRYQIVSWRDELDKEKIELLKENRMIQFVGSIYKAKEVDELLKEYSFQDIMKVIKEFFEEIIYTKTSAEEDTPVEESKEETKE